MIASQIIVPWTIAPEKNRPRIIAPRTTVPRKTAPEDNFHRVKLPPPLDNCPWIILPGQLPQKDIFPLTISP